MIRALAALTVAAAMVVPSVSAEGVSEESTAGSVAPAQQATAEVETIIGSGCPIGTSTVTVSPDNATFAVTYTEYLAQVGVGAKPTDIRKNCQLSLRLQVPQGFTYAIVQADYAGYARLAQGATALVAASYYVQGESETRTVSRSFSGVFDGPWSAVSGVAIADLTDGSYVPCGEQRNLNINTELRVSAGTSNVETTNSFIAMDSTGGHVSTVFHLAWKQCA